MSEGDDPRLYAFEITDHSGQILLELPFIEILGAARGGRRARSALEALERAKTRAESLSGLASAIAREVNTARLALAESRNVLQRAREFGGKREEG
ncbi:MAG: hypothetical protein JO137_07135 [Hyphomicrobiales bacterium]|nr:hypothetical protein [Hyphomicrobiales bacterium]MBV9431579.1 hypothetical protein [Hyphomicrobiales bacterium]